MKRKDDCNESQQCYTNLNLFYLATVEGHTKIGGIFTNNASAFFQMDCHVYRCYHVNSISYILVFYVLRLV